jgi:hypothetical protein
MRLLRASVQRPRADSRPARPHTCSGSPSWRAASPGTDEQARRTPVTANSAGRRGGTRWWTRGSGCGVGGTGGPRAHGVDDGELPRDLRSGPRLPESLHWSRHSSRERGGQRGESHDVLPLPAMRCGRRSLLERVEAQHTTAVGRLVTLHRLLSADDRRTAARVVPRAGGHARPSRPLRCSDRGAHHRHPHQGCRPGRAVARCRDLRPPKRDLCCPPAGTMLAVTLDDMSRPDRFVRNRPWRRLVAVAAILAGAVALMGAPRTPAPPPAPLSR